MRRFLVSSILISSVLCLAASFIAAAQDRSPRYNYQYGASSARDFRTSQSQFASVRSDLDRAENNMPEYAGSRSQLDRVRGELSELQRQWDENVYEPSQADHVIRALERALSSTDILPRDRQLLSDDLDGLRDFRNSHE
ncbi:MAG TPA: hypothetical protein VK724_09225 [Bryobacteraceae bacterium]|jgi:hypothetical protein|nr:hypothetical protein [Bryobacteraceae bacterium]